MNTYFNTTKESGNQLQIFTEQTESQNKTIMRLMEIYTKSSASQLVGHFRHTPITSIRRALTTLAKEGKLIKTDEKVLGNYGRNEYIYRFV